MPVLRSAGFPGLRIDRTGIALPGAIAMLASGAAPFNKIPDDKFFRKHGIEIPFPQCDVRIKSDLRETKESKTTS